MIILLINIFLIINLPKCGSEIYVFFLDGLFSIKKTNDFLNIFISDNEKHQIVKSNITMTKDRNNLLEKSRPSISFNDEEDKKGKQLLSQLGITENDKFICLGLRLSISCS